jgi:hypothetical protein
MFNVPVMSLTLISLNKLKFHRNHTRILSLYSCLFCPFIHAVTVVALCTDVFFLCILFARKGPAGFFWGQSQNSCDAKKEETAYGSLGWVSKGGHPNFFFYANVLGLYGFHTVKWNLV